MTITISRRGTRPAGFAVCALAALLASGQAQANPNFSGEWKLNTSKSDFGPLPGPSTRTDKIAHVHPDLKITTRNPARMATPLSR